MDKYLHPLHKVWDEINVTYPFPNFNGYTMLVKGAPGPNELNVKLPI